MSNESKGEGLYGENDCVQYVCLGVGCVQLEEMQVQRWGCLGCGSVRAVGRVVHVPLSGHCLALVVVSLLRGVMVWYAWGDAHEGDVVVRMCLRLRCCG